MYTTWATPDGLVGRSKCRARPSIDHSARMLDAARAKLSDEPGLAVDLRHGEADALPLLDGEVDAALAHMVLHYLPSPAEAIAEMARVIKPGGRVIAVDFVAHQNEWMRQELGVIWLGFDTDEVASWFERVGLVGEIDRGRRACWRAGLHRRGFR